MDRDDQDLAGGLAESRLIRALENNEFALFCQPIRALHAGEYPLAEVLIRLREEEKALLPPGDFLPVFEHYRMMPQLDLWVVRQVVRTLAGGSRIPCFSINVSTQTIEDDAFLSFFRSVIKAAPEGSLLLEVDEADLLSRPEAVARFAREVKSAGSAIVVDSFGRESVSFGQVQALAPQYVKVDGAVTRKLLSSEVARTKLGAVLRVGEATPFDVIAECVESDEVLGQLRTMGVGYAQGFGVHEPRPLE